MEEQILEFVKKNGTKKFRFLNLGPTISSKAIRMHYKKCLAPNINKRPFTQEEDDTIIKSV